MVSGPAPPLRQALLATRPDDIGVRPTPALAHVWAALLELGVGRGHWATVVAVADGAASLYTSGSFGVIGAGPHERVRSSAQAFLLAVEAAYPELAELNDPSSIPYPGDGFVAVVAMTYDGARRAELATNALSDGSVARAVVAGHELLTQIRIVEESAAGGQSAAG